MIVVTNLAQPSISAAEVYNVPKSAYRQPFRKWIQSMCFQPRRDMFIYLFESNAFWGIVQCTLHIKMFTDDARKRFQQSIDFNLAFLCNQLADSEFEKFKRPYYEPLSLHKY